MCEGCEERGVVKVRARKGVFEVREERELGRVCSKFVKSES